VRFILGHSVEGARTDDGVTNLRLSNDESVAVDAIVAGIGAVPEDGIARTAGLRCDGGILVDHRSRTSDESIYAIGDCTRRPVPFYDRTARLESVPSALEQARQAVADICGTRAPDAEVPWFWSDQYDLKLQIGGLQFDVAASVLRGDVEAGRFALFHLDAAARVQCVEAVNAPQEFMAGKRLIATRRSVVPAQLADVSISMKSMTA
jgi:3-phenylpropionate/trans-cinnamate dioxygenase ferredoxin reductase subunit